MPACDGARRSISAQMPSRVSKPRSPPRRWASSTAIIQSGHATPGRRDLLAEPGDPALDVGGRARALGEARGGQHHVGLARRLVEERVDGDDEAGAARRRCGPVRGRGSRRAGRRRAARAPGARPSAARLQDARGVEPGRLGHRRPRPGSNHARPVVQRHPARQHAGRQAHVERALHVAPAAGRGGSARPAAAASTPAASTTDSADSASDGRPSTTTTGAVRHRGSAGRGRGPRPTPRRRRRSATGAISARATAAASPGR